MGASGSVRDVLARLPQGAFASSNRHRRSCQPPRARKGQHREGPRLPFSPCRRAVRRFLTEPSTGEGKRPGLALRGSRCQTRFRGEGTAMKTKTRRSKRRKAAPVAVVVEDTFSFDSTTTIFSSDLLTPEEGREMLATFGECKSELVRVLLRHFPRMRSHRPAPEPWPMAQFIRDYCDSEARRVSAIRRVHDRNVHC